jgi:hypothetical protein
VTELRPNITLMLALGEFYLIASVLYRRSLVMATAENPSQPRREFFAIRIHLRGSCLFFRIKKTPIDYLAK